MTYAELIAYRDREGASKADRKWADEEICRLFTPSPIAEAAFMALWTGNDPHGLLG